MPRLLILLLCGAYAHSLFADQITLANGDRITGKVLKKQADSVTIKGDLIGEVTLKWKDVASIATEAPVTVVLPEQKTVKGSIATTGDKLVVKTPSGDQEAPLASVGAVRNDAEQRRYERYLHPSLLDLWTGFADFSIADASGNARTLTMATSVNASRTTNGDKTGLYFNQIFARGLLNNQIVDTASAVRGGWLYNRKFGGRMFLNMFNDYEYDRFQSLDLRVVLGAGLGYNVFKRESRQLDLVAGGSWNRESYATPIRVENGQPQFIRNSGEAYWGDDFLARLSKLSSLKQSFRMFHNLQNTGEYRANLDVAIETKLWKALAWQISASDRYISNPAPFRKTNDLLVSSGIRFTFSRLP